MSELGRSLFAALFVELIVVLLTIRYGNNKWKIALFLAIGTFIAGVVGFSPQIFPSVVTPTATRAAAIPTGTITSQETSIVSSPTIRPQPLMSPQPNYQPSLYSPPIGCNGWCLDISGIPEYGSSILVNLPAGELLFLTGLQLQIDSKYCGSDSTQICVLFYQSTKLRQTITIDTLIPHYNYLGVTDIYSPEEVLKIKTPDFWSPDKNCVPNGCKHATVFFFQDGMFIKQESLTP
jgi:hypothetical protein